MSLVSTREHKGYRIDAVWEHDWSESPRFTVTILTPDARELGPWEAQAPEDAVMDWAVGQAEDDLYLRECEELEAEELEAEELEAEELEAEEA